jgi:hypothetical protein
MLLLSEGQTDQAWEPSKALLSLGKAGSVEYKITFTFSLFKGTI